MKQKLFIAAAFFLLVTFVACNSSDKKKETEMKEQKIKEESVSYSLDTVKMIGFIYYDENAEGQRPAVLVVHEWWGVNDYVKMRARKLAELGYISMVVDMFGNGKTADNPADAGKLAEPFYANPQMAKAHFEAAVAELRKNSKTDTAKIGAIGYCFGGGVLLNIARLGDHDLKGVVSFHGSLLGTPAVKDLLTTKILVCHGNADPFVPQADVDQFKKQMDSIGADYTFKAYDGATHAFTNPDATAVGQKFKIPIAYNAAADTASWNDMKQFLADLFR